MREDIFQDILLESWKSYQKFNQKSTFGTWIYRISLNVIYLHYRKNNRYEKNEVYKSFYSSNEKQKKSPQAEKLYQIIKTLDTVEKSIISAHLDGYSNKEIAEIIGVSTNNIGVKLYRIKEYLKKELVKK